MPNRPRIAFGIWDADTEKWPEALKEPYKDVLNDPVAWAKKDVGEFGAELLCLRLQSTDPNGKNASAESVLPLIERMLNAVKAPLIISGVVNIEKDRQVLSLVAEKFDRKNLVLWPVEDENYKQIGASAIGYGQIAAASTPIDVNLAKQLNTLLESLGLKANQIVMDPTTGALGYGIEYSYSVMERDRLAALVAQDEKMQKPMLNFVGQEVWKLKEMSLSRVQAPSLGDPKLRGIIYEAVTAALVLLAGSDIVVMLHPTAISYAKKLIEELMK
jgi:acetyl-CoA decarbonylase/synthase complex subunit delta